MREWKVVVYIALCTILTARCSLRKDSNYWRKLAIDELDEALGVKWNVNTAKNMIIFIGDGMGPNTITATRIYKGGESHRLSYEMFPHVGLLKTYSADMMVPDSASTASALLCGVKVNQNTIAVDSSVRHRDCEGSLDPQVQLDSLAAWALRAGKSAGFVTTMRVTHATPGPVYAHSAARQWECDAKMPTGTDCKDIARQLIEDWPGKDLNREIPRARDLRHFIKAETLSVHAPITGKNDGRLWNLDHSGFGRYKVIMGGGRQALVTNSTEPISPWGCSRLDGRNLIKDYKQDKENRKLKYSVVSNNRELQEFDVNETDYLLGIFGNDHLRYENERNKGPDGSPSISEMVVAAIKVLKRNPNGFFLMVEGGNIDMAHHRGRAKLAVDEASAMEDAVRTAVEMTDEVDTLVVVTSDHTHTLTINGYPKRGTNIFGTIGPSKIDGLNYTTLAYGTGGPGGFQFTIDANSSRIVRQDPSTVNTDSFKYEQIAAVPLEENVHGGGDVVVYARGPYAHLFHNVHEQNYVFHVMSYAAKLGPYSAGHSLKINVAIFVATLLLLVIITK